MVVHSKNQANYHSGLPCYSDTHTLAAVAKLSAWLRVPKTNARRVAPVPTGFLITTQAKRNLSSRSGIGGVRSAT